MTAIVAMLPDWYCAQYARQGCVSYWQTLRALAGSPIRALGNSDPVWLELLSILSLLQFMVYVRWGTGPTPELRALEQICPDWTWLLMSIAVLAVQVVAWARWNDNNRMASLAISGLWWGLLSALIIYVGGFLAVHITTPWLAALCLIAARRMAVRSAEHAGD